MRGTLLWQPEWTSQVGGLLLPLWRSEPQVSDTEKVEADSFQAMNTWCGRCCGHPHTLQVDSGSRGHNEQFPAC